MSLWGSKEISSWGFCNGAVGVPEPTGFARSADWKRDLQRLGRLENYPAGRAVPQGWKICGCRPVRGFKHRRLGRRIGFHEKIGKQRKEGTAVRGCRTKSSAVSRGRTESGPPLRNQDCQPPDGGGGLRMTKFLRRLGVTGMPKRRQTARLFTRMQEHERSKKTGVFHGGRGEVPESSKRAKSRRHEPCPFTSTRGK